MTPQQQEVVTEAARMAARKIAEGKARLGGKAGDVIPLPRKEALKRA